MAFPVSFKTVHKQSASLALAATTNPALLIWYVGSGAATVTSTSITLVFTDTATGKVLPTDGTTTAGTLTFSVGTVDTVGELAAVINASTGFKAVIVNALTSDATTGGFTTFSATAVTRAPLQVCWLGTVVTHQTLSIGPESDFLNLDSLYGAPHQSNGDFLGLRDPDLKDTMTPGGACVLATRMVSRLLLATFTGKNSTTTATPYVNVYDASQTGETLVYTSAQAASNTSKSDPPAFTNQMIQSTTGNRLVIRLLPGVSDFTSGVAGLTVVGNWGEPGNVLPTITY